MVRDVGGVGVGRSVGEEELVKGEKWVGDVGEDDRNDGDGVGGVKW